MTKPEAAAGSSLGDFAIAGVLGEGGSGIVYDARWGHREVALKVLHPVLVATAREREQFLAEARLLAEISHPAVVKVLHVGELPDGRPYLAMEKLSGETLAERLARGALPLEDALELFGQLADAVEALHGRLLVHRDLKPENVMLVPGPGGEHAVLLDFGIAKDLTAPASTTTQSGGIRGTPAYMAPERFFGQPASVATDVYELAVTLFAMIAGRLPWDDCGDPEVRLDPRRLTEVAPHAPAALDVELRRALSTRAAMRPASVIELRTAMAAATGAPIAPRHTLDVARPATVPPPIGIEKPPEAWFNRATAVARPERAEPMAIAPTELAVSSTTAAPRRSKRGLVIGLVAGAGVLAAAGLIAARVTGEPAPAKAAPLADDPSDPWSAGAAMPDRIADKLEPAVPSEPPPAPPIDAGPLRAAMAAAVPHLPADEHFAAGLVISELRSDRDLAGVVRRIMTAPEIAGAVTSIAGTCTLDLPALLDWVVLAGDLGEDGAPSDHTDIIVSGRWSRGELEACLGSLEGTTVERKPAPGRKDGTPLTVLRHKSGDRWFAWLDEHTVVVTQRADGDQAWLADRLAAGAGPSGEVGELLGGLDLSSTFWMVGDVSSMAESTNPALAGILHGHAVLHDDRVEGKFSIRYPEAGAAEKAGLQIGAILDALQASPGFAAEYGKATLAQHNRDVEIIARMPRKALRGLAKSLTDSLDGRLGSSGAAVR